MNSRGKSAAEKWFHLVPMFFISWEGINERAAGCRRRGFTSSMGETGQPAALRFVRVGECNDLHGLEGEVVLTLIE